MADEDTADAPSKSHKRIRVSVWLDAVAAASKGVADYKDIVDDISLLTSFVLDKNMYLVFDSNITETRLGDAIANCHKNRIQCLAGFGAVTDTALGKRIQDFVKSATAASLKTMAQAFAAKVNADYKDSSSTPRRFDGISFDIEVITDKTLGSKYSDFYRAIADELAAATGDHANKFVSIANGGLVTDTDATRPGGGALSSAIAQPYSMAVNKPNLVLRPMCYDAFAIEFVSPGPHTDENNRPPTRRVSGAPNSIKKWHEDIWTYATTKSVPPEQFQYGIKTFAGTKNVAQKAFHPKKDPNDKTEQPVFKEWTLTNTSDGYMDEPPELRARVREMRVRKTGIIFFGMHTAANVAKINFILNTTTSAPQANDQAGDYPDFDAKDPSKNTAKPSAVTVPRQFPHTKESIDRLEKF